MTYNGDNLRVSQTADGLTTRYAYEYTEVVLELDGQGNETAFNLRGLTLLSRTTDEGKSHFMHNGHGDVTALVDNAGSLIATYYYDAFGNHKSVTGDANNPYRYSGYMFDEASGLYYLKARFYDPELARFLQEDTYRGNTADPLSLNLYAYCSNNPVRYWDQTGHAVTAWDLANCTSTEVERIRAATVAYEEAKKLGNTTAMAEAHQAAIDARTPHLADNQKVGSCGNIIVTGPLTTISQGTVLANGSSGTGVRALQQELNALGIRDDYGNALREDGIFGANTQAAVRNYQRANGLVVDGLAGNRTLGCLGLSKDTGDIVGLPDAGGPEGVNPGSHWMPTTPTQISYVPAQYVPGTQHAIQLGLIEVKTVGGTKIYRNSGHWNKSINGNPKGVLFYRSKMSVCIDGSDRYREDPDGKELTSLKYSNGKQLDADTVKYIVIPTGWYQDVNLGDYGVVYDTVTGKAVWGIVGEKGPTYETGEVSYALANELVPNRNLDYNNGMDEAEYATRFLYLFFPGSGEATGNQDDGYNLPSTFTASNINNKISAFSQTVTVDYASFANAIK